MLTFILTVLPEKAATRAATLPEELPLPLRDPPLLANTLPLLDADLTLGVAGSGRGGMVAEGCSDRQPSKSRLSSCERSADSEDLICSV